MVRESEYRMNSIDKSKVLLNLRVIDDEIINYAENGVNIHNYGCQITDNKILQKSGIYIDPGYMVFDTIRLQSDEDFTISFWSKRITYYINYDIVLGYNDYYSFQTQDSSYQYRSGMRIDRNGYGGFNGNIDSRTSINQPIFYAVVNIANDKAYFFENGICTATRTNFSFITAYIHAGFGSTYDGNPGIIDDLLITKQALWDSNFENPITYLLDKDKYSIISSDNNLYK